LNDETTTKEELINFVKERVAPYKKIRDVIFMEELPLTPVGKVLKRTLRKKLIKEKETTKNS
jgi:acyl-coenzyme A synthetase/AMP-(fatty) acid ligase